MNFKKILSAVAAAAVFASVSASANAAGKMKLLTKSVDDVLSEISKDAKSLGPSYSEGIRQSSPYFVANSDGRIIDAVDISESNLKKWRKTGNFTYSDVDTSDFGGAIEGGNLICYNNTSNLNYYDGSGYYIYSYEDGKLNKLGSFNGNTTWGSSDYDGWMFKETVVDNETVKFSVENLNNGKTVSSKDLGSNYIAGGRFAKGEYIGYVMYVTSIEPDNRFGDYDKYGYNLLSLELYGFNRNGDVKKIYTESNATYTDLLDTFDDGLLFYTQTRPLAEILHIFNADTGKITSFSSEELYGGLGTEELPSSFDIVYCDNGKAAIMGYDKSGNNVGAALIEFGETYTFSRPDYRIDYKLSKYTVLTDDLKYIGRCDDGIFLIETSDEKWGYMNEDGEILATYDDAGDFGGKYAPVVQDGKAYLIDRNFKCVSEKISAESVSTIDDGLYKVTIGGEYYFMTYSGSGSSKTTNISDLTFSKVGNKAYTGKALKPSVTVKDGSTKLVKGTDYTVSYKNNTKIGTATITIKGKGDYTGTKKITFNIVPKKTKLSIKQSGSSATLSWKKSKGADGYEIYRATLNNSYELLTTVKAGTLKKKVTLSSDNVCKFKIRPYTTVNGKKVYGSYSNIVSL